MSRVHQLPARPDTVVGEARAGIAPALVVESGDEVELSCLDAWWCDTPHAGEHAPRATAWPLPGPPTGHALTGPVAVRGLKPGDVLQVEVLKVATGGYGFTDCGGGSRGLPHYQQLGCDDGPGRMLLWELDAGVARCTNMPGLVVPARPFPGWLGMPAAIDPFFGHTTPPRRTGGNLDCNLLTAGSTLYLPVEVEGGLLLAGDGHAAQGDGEWSNNGIECALTRLRLRLTRRADLAFDQPAIRTAAGGWAVLGLGPTLDDAAHHAARGMLDLLMRELRITRPEALGVMSVAVDFRVTQVVNGIKGVHAVWGGAR